MASASSAASTSTGFGTWIALAGLAVALAAPAAAQDMQRGQEVFGLCAQCHGEQGQGNRMALAPAIAGLPEWYVEAQLRKFRSGVRGAHPEDVAGLRMLSIGRYLDGDAHDPSDDDEDLTDVAAYVASLPRTHPTPQLEGGDAERGKALFTPCTACHGADAAGNQALNAPPLVGSSDWYLLSQLEKFKAGIRGGNPADATGMQMRGMSMILADQQAMLDVIAYVTSLDAEKK